MPVSTPIPLAAFSARFHGPADRPRLYHVTCAWKIGAGRWRVKPFITLARSPQEAIDTIRAHRTGDLYDLSGAQWAAEDYPLGDEIVGLPLFTCAKPPGAEDATRHPSPFVKE